ncbi:amino acid ABC transporter ATP-binding/permease protein [Cutibacterium namnetense]|uniref:ABC transporter, ATP-binding protein n=1 Tax=[Propionibacterium] namnetense SK182B-JCVI TaxID=1051006 RepID=F9NU42_9ACTN|nr:ABC transporter ATP-binding protein [Cutibacterium namnetense]EGR97565.1 ABC transporter, ATP-binding protein [ [[Propionibacterium] namnetense SK182B-JCVI]
MTEPSTWQVVRWLTGITRPVHPPLYFSALMRVVHLLADIGLFAMAAGGMVAVVTSGWSAWAWLGWVVGLAAVQALAYYLEQLSGHYVAFKALEILRTYAFSQLWPKAPAVVSHSRTGDVLASLTRDVDRIEVVYAHTFAPVVAAIVAPLVAVVTGGVLYGWFVVAVPAVIVAVLIAALLVIGTRASLCATHEMLGVRRELAAHITDSVFGAAEIVGYGRQCDRAMQMARLDADIAAGSAKARRYTAMRRAFCVAATMGIVASVSIVGVGAGASVVGVCVLVAAGLRIVEGPRGIEDAVGYLDHSLAAARRLWCLSHAPVEVVDGSEELCLNHAPRLEWRGVTFCYRDVDGSPLPAVLRDVTLSVPAGGRVVVAGASGSGKTTLVNLLLRHHDPDAGQVLVDGEPVSLFTLDSLRRSVAVVSQRVELLNASVADNLRLVAPDAGDGELWRVLGEVDLADEVRGMEAGLRTIVGSGGTRLSGGQAQRLTVARAILQQPRVLILDEFTASLDPGLAAEIRVNLARCLPEVTVVEISHECDRVGETVVMDRGRIVKHLY